MPFSLLLLPLLGGYLVVHFSTWGRYYHDYLDRQRLLFHSALAGIGLLIIALVLRSLVGALGIRPWFTSVTPVDLEYFWTSIASLLLGAVIAGANRRFASRNVAVRRAAKTVGSELDVLLTEAYFGGTLLLVSLDTGKFYVAWIDSYPRPNRTTHIRLIPFYSGYRDDRRELVFTTSYEEVYRSLLGEGTADPVRESRVAVVVELSDITSLSVFDLGLFSRFGKPGPSAA